MIARWSAGVLFTFCAALVLVSNAQPQSTSSSLHNMSPRIDLGPTIMQFAESFYKVRVFLGTEAASAGIAIFLMNAPSV